jgi:hypothetical protein
MSTGPPASALQCVRASVCALRVLGAVCGVCQGPQQLIVHTTGSPALPAPPTPVCVPKHTYMPTGAHPHTRDHRLRRTPGL